MHLIEYYIKKKSFVFLIFSVLDTRKKAWQLTQLIMETWILFFCWFQNTSKPVILVKCKNCSLTYTKHWITSNFLFGRVIVPSPKIITNMRSYTVKKNRIGWADTKIFRYRQTDTDPVPGMILKVLTTSPKVIMPKSKTFLLTNLFYFPPFGYSDKLLRFI